MIQPYPLLWPKPQPEHQHGRYLGVSTHPKEGGAQPYRQSARYSRQLLVDTLPSSHAARTLTALSAPTGLSTLTTLTTHSTTHPYPQVAGNLDPGRSSWPRPIGKGNRWVQAQAYDTLPPVRKPRPHSLTPCTTVYM